MKKGFFYKKEYLSYKKVNRISYVIKKILFFCLQQKELIAWMQHVQLLLIESTYTLQTNTPRIGQVMINVVRFRFLFPKRPFSFDSSLRTAIQSPDTVIRFSACFDSILLYRIALYVFSFLQLFCSFKSVYIFF